MRRGAGAKPIQRIPEPVMDGFRSPRATRCTMDTRTLRHPNDRCVWWGSLGNGRRSEAFLVITGVAASQLRLSLGSVGVVPRRASLQSSQSQVSVGLAHRTGTAEQDGNSNSSGVRARLEVCGPSIEHECDRGRTRAEFNPLRRNGAPVPRLRRDFVAAWREGSQVYQSAVHAEV